MKKIKFFSIGLCFALVLAGCNNTQKGAAIGAGGGAVLGAIVGKLAGNTAVGAAVGAAVGTGAGAIIGKKMDKAKAQAEAVKNAQVQQVTDINGLPALKVTFDSGILFTTNKAELNAAAKTSLTEFSKVVKENSDMDIAIIGHTDNTGSDAINNTMKENSNKSVSTYLKNSGVNASQIKTVEGQGSKNPVADNSTAEGRTQNRRVEVYIYASQEMIKAAEAQANQELKN